MTELIGQVDYTLLDQNATIEEIVTVCKSAIILGVKSVCVLPQHVEFVFDAIFKSSVLVCSVVSFPNGEATIEAKKDEIKQLIQSGADEIDIVWNYKRIEDKTYLQHELNELSMFCKTLKTKRNTPLIVKIIVESGVLTLDETLFATNACITAGVDFIKTSTGKVEIGAELDKIQVMSQQIREKGASLQIKASGGIRTLAQIESFQPYVHRYGIGYKTVDALLEGSFNCKSQEY